MRKYIVEVPEIHRIRYYVEAASPEEALERIALGDAEYDESTLVYEGSLPVSEWRIVDDPEASEEPGSESRARSTVRHRGEGAHVHSAPRPVGRG